MIVLIVSCLFLFICLAAVDAKDTSLSGEIGGDDWEFPAGLVIDNGFRGEVILNGFWAGRSQGENTPFIKTRVPDVCDRRARKEYYRDFSLPAAWEGRRLVLSFSRLQRNTIVMFDGKLVPISVSGHRFVDIPLKITARGGATHRMQIVTGMIDDDIWLRSYPQSVTCIDDSFIMTSYRDMSLNLRLAGTGEPGASLHPTAYIYDHPEASRLVKTLHAETPVTVGDDGRWETELNAPWPDARLWSRWHPNLYYYTAEIGSSAGKVYDRILPRRFGFREIWVESGRFVINGIPFTGADDVWHPGTNLMREEMEAIFASVRKLGLTMAFRVSSDMMLDVADEQGTMVEIDAGSLVRINIWDTSSGLTNMSGKEDEQEIRECIRRWREHPSILLWHSAAPFSHNTLYAGHVGQPYNPWDYFPGNRNAKPVREAHEIFRDTCTLIHTLDPTRPVATANSPYSNVERVTRYLCDNLDLQEEEEFFDYWFRSGSDVAIWIAEFGMPFQGHDFIRKIDHQMSLSHCYQQLLKMAPDLLEARASEAELERDIARRPAIYLERAARQFGDAVYLDTPDDTLMQWPLMSFVDHRDVPVYQRIRAESIYHIWQAWRTYGVSGSAHHTARDGFGVNTELTTQQRYNIPDEVDPRRAGLSRVIDTFSFDFPVLGVDSVLPAGQAYLHGVSPLLAYIGGVDTHFTAKDHLNYTGAEVRKAVIVINDFDDPVELTGEWQLLAVDGSVVKKGAIQGTVNPGCRALQEFPINFTAPEVNERTDYRIVLRLQANLPGTLEDSFPITVFPRHKTAPLQFSGNIWRLNISDDRTHEAQHFFINRENDAFLEAAGVSSQLIKGLKTFTWVGTGPDAAEDIDRGRKLVTEGTPRPGDLLIIPRHCLEMGHDDRQLNLRLLKEMGLDSLIEQGLRVIVFEQNLPNVFGINTEDVRPRHVFMAAPGHPVFAGLEDSDLAYWSEDSDLDIAMSPISMSERQLPERIWHVSNTNAVASKTFIRPQVGAARALAVSGFDLQESPLLEVTRGKGRILFCQFDVTNRYGSDPAATQLVDNIFAYMTGVAEPDPAKSSVAFLPEDGKKVIAKSHVFHAAKPDGEEGWGITNGELFFRESIYIVSGIVDKLPDTTIPVLADSPVGSLPQVIQLDPASGRLAMTLRESLFTTGWQQRKIAWLHAALLVNQGGSSLCGPALSLQGNITELYPTVWVDDFVHPYTADLW